MRVEGQSPQQGKAAIGWRSGGKASGLGRFWVHMAMSGFPGVARVIGAWSQKGVVPF